MNADNITDIRAQASGVFYVAPKGTTLPADASTALGADFKQLGYAAKDGLTISDNRETVQWDAWESDDVVRVSESHTVELSFRLMEPFQEQAAKLLFGSGNVTVASDEVTKIVVNDEDLDESVLVAEMLLRDGTKMRMVVGRFQPTEVGEMTLQRGEFFAPEVTGAALGQANGEKIAYYFA
jgi:hypothetical protein